MMSNRDDRLAAALAFAEQGWPVHPCRDRKWKFFEAGTPLLPRDKDPETGKAIPKSGGLKKASIDKGKIREFWTLYPNALIGVCTGSTRLFVVDFDPRVDEKAGEVWTLESLLDDLEKQMGESLPETLRSVTPSGGHHYWFRWPDDDGDPIRNRGNLPDKIDVRGVGGYVVAPPGEREASPDKPGGAYTWLNGDPPNFEAIVEAPASLVKILREPKAKKGGGAKQPAMTSGKRARPAPLGEGTQAGIRKYAMSALEQECRRLETAASGERNSALNQAAFVIATLASAGALQEHMAKEALLAAARSNTDDDEDQLHATLESGWIAGQAKPRDLKEIEDNIRSRSSSSPRRRAATGGQFKPSSQMGERAGSAIGENWRVAEHGGVGEGRPVEEIDRECAFLPLTDYGNAERFMTRYGRDFLFVKAWGWLAWDGRRWNREDADAIVAQAEAETIRAIQREGIAVQESGVRPKADEDEENAQLRLHWIDREREDGLDFFVKWKGPQTTGQPIYQSDQLKGWGRTSESKSHLACVADIAKRWLTVRTEDFDADPFKLNLANGTLEFRGPGEHGAAQYRLEPHNRDDRMTKISETEYDKEARAPLFDAFFERVQPKAEDRRYLHAWAGYNMTGSIAAQKLLFNYGEGANGKSTWIDIIAWILGGYGTTVGIETFIDQGKGRKGGDATPDLADLVGRRLVRTSEPEKNTKFADALIKLVTGGEPMKVRFLNKDFFEMIITWKLTVSGNHKPGIGTDHGIWRRMRLMPWPIKIPEDEKDEELVEKLKAEASGILNHMIAGCLDWLDNGLVEPESMVEATAQYREGADPLGQFLELCIEHSENSEDRVQSSVLHGVYQAWCAWAGEKAWAQRGFSNAMMERGFVKKHSNNIVWLNMKLTRSEMEFIDEQGEPRTGKVIDLTKLDEDEDPVF